MLYKMSPIVESHLILVTTWGNLTQSELFAYDEEAVNLLRASPLPLVHGICDYGHLEGFPSLINLAALKAGKERSVNSISRGYVESWHKTVEGGAAQEETKSEMAR